MENAYWYSSEGVLIIIIHLEYIFHPLVRPPDCCPAHTEENYLRRHFTHWKMMKFTDLHAILPYYCYSVFADKYTKLGIESDAVFFLSLTDVHSAFSSEHNLRFLGQDRIWMLVPPCIVISKVLFNAA